MIRKKTLYAFIFLLLFTAGNAGAQSRQFDAGLILGEPTGLSFKLWDSAYSELTRIAGNRENAAAGRRVVNAGHTLLGEFGVKNEDIDDFHSYVNSGASAIAGAVAWSFVDEGAFHAHIDYLRHRFDIFTVDEGELFLYYGLGGRVKTEKDDTRAGIRFPFGLDYLIPKTEIDMFFEIVPVMDIAPETSFRMNAAIGFRYALGYIGGNGRRSDRTK